MSPYDLQQYARWSSIEPAKIYVHEDMAKVWVIGKKVCPFSHSNPSSPLQF